MLSWDVSQNPSPVPSVRCGALQPQGEAPASSPARAGQAEHLAPRRGHRHRPTHPSAPIVLLGVKEASPTPSSPPLCQASPRVTQAPGLDSPHSLKRLKAELQHFVGDYSLQLLVSSAVRARGFLFYSGSTHLHLRFVTHLCFSARGNILDIYMNQDFFISKNVKGLEFVLPLCSQRG